MTHRNSLQRLLNLQWLKRQPALVVLLLATIVGVLTFGICLIAVVGAWLIMGAASGEAVGINWELPGLLEGVFTAGGFALGVGAGLLALVELGEISESRNLDIYKDIFEKLMIEDEIDIRRQIYQLEGSEDEIIQLALTDSTVKANVKRVLNVLDYLGFLIMQDWVTRDDVIGWVSPIVVKLWEKLEPIVTYERKQRPNEPDYYEAAIYLAEKCIEWRKKWYGASDVEFREDAL
jgi:hypothetical protein